ncbi:MAG TPA: hypothetical protein EYP14_12755, partial [Planctomycetaceae bacterium]|nr:hypothetical protein [Planctomycetaceae bacterium]
RLEDRTLLSVQFFFDYSRDATGFFSDPQRRQVLELAGQQLGSRLNDTLLEINQSTFDNGLYQWTAEFTNPATGQADEVPGLVVPQDTIYVFVGARDLGGLLAMGGPGGFRVVGPPPFQPWFDRVKARGQTGALETPATDYATWGGQITFDSSTNWYFGTTTAGLDSGEADFYSVALHELSHLIGFGIADSWDALLNGTAFTGTQSVGEYDGTGNVPVAPDLAHWAEGTQDGGQETAMDPSLQFGTRKTFTPLDFAGLADIGWEVSSNDTYTITVSDGAGHTIVVSDDGDPANGLSQVTIDGVPTLFANPTTSLIINGADSEDTITVNPLDPGFGATIVINGGAGNDAFIIDPEASRSITVNGDAGNDTLTFPSGAADSVTHTFAGPALGSVTVTADSQTTTVDYISLGPIKDNLMAVDRVFNFGLSSDELTLDDNGTVGDGLSRLSSVSSSEPVDFVGPTGSLTINSSSGDDTVRLQAVDDLFAATITVDSGDGNDLIDASAMLRSVTLTGQSGDDTLMGGAGSDWLEDRLGRNSIVGAGGNDVLVGGIGPDYLEGGAGADRLFGSAGADTLLGGEGDDALYGQGNGDSLQGGAGNDLLRGRVGHDTLSGGTGDDTIDGEDGTDLVVETADTDWTLTDSSLAGLGIDSLISIERAALAAGPGNNTLTAAGFSGRTTLDGAAGDDTLIGGDGNDRLLGGSGLNVVSGGPGNDTLAGGVDRDSLFGEEGDDYLLGSAGGDFLDGGPGTDYLSGQGGSLDTLTGGNGDDTLDGGPGSDWLLESGDADFVLTDSALSGRGNDILIRMERARLALTGTAGRSISAVGFSGRATLLGGPGDDTLEGGPGDDRLLAKDGNNLVRGGPGADLL